MANYAPQLPRPEDNSITAVRHVDSMSPAQAAAPAEAMGRAFGASARLADRLLQMHYQTQYNEGSVNLDKQMAANKLQVTEDPNNYLTALQTYNQGNAKIQGGIAALPYGDAVKQKLQQDYARENAVGTTQMQAWVWGRTKDHYSLTAQSAAEHQISIGAAVPLNSAQFKIAQAQLAANAKGYNTWQDSAVGEKILSGNLAALDAGNARHTILSGHPQQALADLNAGNYKNLATGEKDTLTKIAQEQIKGEQARASAGTDYTIHEALANALLTGRVDPGMLATIRAHGTAEAVARFNQALPISLEGGQDAQQFSSMTVAERNAVLQKWDARVKAGGPQELETADVAQRLTAQADKWNKGFNTDPVAYSQQTAAGQAAIKVAGGQVDLQTPKGMALQIKLADTVYGQEKTPPAQRTYLSKQQLADFRTSYLAQPPDQARAWLNNLENNIPYDKFDNFMKQLRGKGGLPPSAMLYDRGMTAQAYASIKATDNVTLSTLEAAVQKSNPVTRLSINTAIQGQLTQVAPALGAAYTTMGLGDVFSKLVYQNILQGQDPGAAAKSAKEDLFGEYTFKGTWMFPSNTSPAEQNLIQQYGQRKILETPLKGYHGNPQALKREQQLLSAMNHWQYLPQSNSYLLLDGNGMAVKGTDGNPVSFTAPQAIIDMNQQ